MDHTSSWPSSFWGGELQNGEVTASEDGLKQALLRTTLELESTRMIAQEELKKLESQSLHLARLLQVATRERDEAQQQCRSLLLLVLNAATAPQPSPIVPNDPQSVDDISTSSSSSEESSKVSSHPAAMERDLPEKGRLVEAVMAAGPLLQTLLLAGPMPQWRHPPPAMQSVEIPPVSIDDFEKKKRKGEEQGEQSPVTSNGNSKFHNHHHSASFGV